MDVRSSEKQMSEVGLMKPEEVQVVILCSRGFEGLSIAMSSEVMSMSKTSSQKIALVTSPCPIPLPGVR